MQKVESTTYIGDDNTSYFVFMDAVIDNKMSSYILHCEGNPRVLYKLWKEIKDDFADKEVYYMLKRKEILGNHSIKVTVDNNGQILYKYDRRV